MEATTKRWCVVMSVFVGITLSSGAYAATITVEAGGDLAAANATAVAGDVIEIAAGTYVLSAALEIKDGVTYQGAGSGETILDCNGLTRAFDGRGDTAQNDSLPYSETGYPANTSGPQDWMIKGLTVINGVADAVNKSVERVGADPNRVPPLTDNVISHPGMSTSGGGLVLGNDAQGTLVDVAFDNCLALATGVNDSDPNLPTFLGYGGAVYMNGATADVVDCSFTGCMASNDGGAINASNPVSENLDLSIENSIFVNNRARDDGGAISSVRRNLSVINCTAEGNQTGLDLENDNVSGDPDGGFLYATGADKVNETGYNFDTPLEMLAYGGVVHVVDCNISNGSARRGGAMRSNSCAQLFVTNTTIADCHARGNDGGGIYASGPSPINPDANAVGDPGVYVEGVSIDGCTAGDDGGGIHVDNWSTTSNSNYLESPTVVINDTVVTNCGADLGESTDGGGIFLNNKLDITITHTRVDHCTSSRHGAGIMIDGTIDMATLDSCQISNCANNDSRTDGDGAALCFDQDDNKDITVSNCIFANNVNLQDDGVVRIDAELLTVANCTLVGNSSADKGILYFGTSKEDASVVTNIAFNNLFVNNDSSPGSDSTLGWSKSGNNNMTQNNGFFGSVLDGDSEIKNTSDADLGLTGNFITTVDPVVDAVGGDYHLAIGSEAIDAGSAEGAPDQDIEGTVRPQGAAPDVGAYESL